MSRPWTSANCIKSIENQIEERERRSTLQTRMNKEFTELKETVLKVKSSGIKAVAVISAILAFIAGMVGAIAVDAGIQDFIWFFVVLFSGGALGATLSVIGTERDTPKSIWGTLVVGGGVGIIVGILQIAPNLSNIFEEGGPPQVSIELIFSSAVFALLGGLAFESTLQNLITRGRNQSSELAATVEEEDTNKPFTPAENE
jgi:hypothetical protein